ncbi:MAG: radical SAM protein [Clostridiales bacterium]|jgi:adenine C2-methylase RlmN of 23S rRNA A2503 and tRNA A37|nr:radical SAM protein [Clostridiales bacterium]
MKKSLLEFDDTEMKALMLSMGQPAFRAKQISEGLFSGRKLGEMSNIPADLKARLADGYTDIPIEIEKKFFSCDGTVKYLFRLWDGELIESVLMTYKYGKTLCISTQIGCRMRCAFCASGLDGLKRNLTAAEMLAQIIAVNRDGGGAETVEIRRGYSFENENKSTRNSCGNPKYKDSENVGGYAFENIEKDTEKLNTRCKSAENVGGKVNGNAGNNTVSAKENAYESSVKYSRVVTNVVLMGSGEPLDNYDNVCKFLKLASAPYALNIGGRNISLSTAGLADKIRTIADCGFQFNLTVSLHAPNDEIRSAIMPVNKKYNIAEVLSAARRYFERTGRRLIFEYSLIKGVNDGRENAAELVRLLKGTPCHVNLIKLNRVEKTRLKGCGNTEAKEFLSVLTDGGISATPRRIMGADIEGACGQLKRRYGGIS